MSELADKQGPASAGFFVDSGIVLSRRPCGLRPAPLIAGLFLATIWLLTHRYHGIRHDGLFYAGQALAHLDPAAFRNDLFFAFGSQADYSLFGPPYALMIQWLGIGSAALSLMILSQLAWVAAIHSIARQWLAGPALWMALAMVFALPRNYGSSGDLHFAESFLTARSWAEPLVLMGVAAVLRNRHGLAFVLLGLAAIVHPIMALPGLIFLAASILPASKTLYALLAAVAFAVAVVMPAIDGEWLEIVLRRAPFVLMTNWTASELLEPLAWIGIIHAASGFAEGRMRTLLEALVVAGSACLLIGLLGTFSHASAILQSQAWRGIWLVKAIAPLTLVWLFARRWSGTSADRWWLAGLGAAAITAPTLGGPVAVALAQVSRHGWKNGGAPSVPRWLPPSAGVALGAIALETMLEITQQAGFLGQRLIESMATGRGSGGDLAAFLDGPLAYLLLLGLWAIVRLGASWPRSAVVASAAVFGVALTGWNQDHDPGQSGLFSANAPRPFAGHLMPGVTIYWHNDFRQSWFRLRTSNYGSIHQSVGVVFSPDTAREARRRLARLADFGAADGERPGKRGSRQDGIPPPTIPGLVELCEDPILDAVVLGRALPSLGGPQWMDSSTGTTWTLHWCANARGKGAERSPGSDRYNRTMTKGHRHS